MPEEVVAMAVKGLQEHICMLKYQVSLDSDTPGITHFEKEYVTWFLIMLVENQMNGGIFRDLEKGLGGEEKVEGAVWLCWGILKYMLYIEN